MLITKQEDTDLKHFSNPKAFIEYSNGVDDICKSITECNPNKKQKVLTVFHDMVTDMLNNKKLNPIVTELLIRGIKLKICFYYKILFFCIKKY